MFTTTLIIVLLAMAPFAYHVGRRRSYPRYMLTEDYITGRFG